MTRCTNARRSRILVTSFGASIGAIVVLAVAFFLCGTSAEAANNCTLTTTVPTTTWSDQTKWSGCGGTYPNNGDTANIGLSGFTINVDVPVNVNLQMTNGATIAVNNTLQLESSSTATSSGTIAVNSGGKLSVAPSITITGVQSALTINNGGIFEVQSGSQFNIGPGASFVFAGGTLQGPGTLSVPVSTPIAFTGANGAMTMTNALILNNSGTVNLVSSTNPLAINSGTQFNNQSGATFNLNTNIAINTDNVSAPAINNSGTISIPPNISPTVNPPLNNNGTISLNDTSLAQTLTLNGGGTHTGTFSTLSGPAGTVKFNGPHNFNSGWVWSTNPNSTFELAGGTSTVTASFTTPKFIQDAGTLAGNGNVTATSSFDWKGGTQTGLGLTILSGAAGTIDGTSTATLDGRTLHVQSAGGSLTYNPGAGGSLALINSAILAATDPFDLKSDTTITSDGSTVISIGSGGSITKSAGSRTQLNPFVSLSNGATIQPTANTIALGGGATLSGAMNTATASSFIEIAGNTATLSAGASVSSGDFLLTGGTLAANTPLTINTLSQSAGVLKGTSTLTVNNTFNWTGGTMDGDTGGTGTLIISSPNGIANINGSGPTTLQHRFSFVNGGTTHYQPINPLAVNTGGQITNLGTWNLENNTAITSDLSTYLATAPLFTNNSLLSKTVGGTTSFGIPINNTATISLNGGSDVELTGGGTINGGAITFNNIADVLGIQTSNVTVTNPPSTTGPGFLRVGNLGTLTQSTPAMTVPNFELDTNGTLSNANVFIIGTKLIWTGGLMTGGGSTALSLGGTGDMSVMSGSPALNTYTFQNNGAITLGNAFPLQFQGSAIFNNTSTGTLDVIGGGGTSSVLTGNSLTNAGTLKRSTANGIYSVDLPFTNTGTVDAAFANAFFDFQGGGSMTAGNMSGSVASAGVEFSSGTFNVSGGSFAGVGGVKINGGTLNVSTAVTGPNSMALLSGTLGTTGGTISFNSPAVFNMTGGTISNVQLIANTGGQIKFDSTTSLLNVDGAIIGYNSGGTGQWIGGNALFMKNGASMSIGGTVTFAGSGNVTTIGTTPTITVNGGGTLQKTTSASNIGIAANVQNNGILASTSGALQLNYSGSSSHTGTFSTTSPGTIDFGGGTHTFTSVTGTGTGFLNFSSGTINLVNTNTLNNLYLGTATINGAGTLTFTGTFNWDGGALNAPTTNSGGTLNLLGGAGQMNLGANLSSGANFSSPTNAFAIGNSITYTNNGTFTITGNAPINGAGTFTNSGSLTKSAGTANTIFNTFNNNGTVNAGTGTLTFAAGGSDTGAYTSTSGATITFSGGVRSLSTAAVIGAAMNGTTSFTGGTFVHNGTFTPSGPVTINGATVTLSTTGTTTINGLSFTSGTINTLSPLQLLGTANQWGGGTITGGAGLQLPSGAVLTLTSGTGPVLDVTPFTVGGTINATAAGQTLSIDNNALLGTQPSGIIDIQNSYSFTTNGNGNFNNAGTVKKSCCAAQTSAVAVAFNNLGNLDAQAGTLDFSSFLQSNSGVTKLSGGSLSSAAVMNFTSGTLIGSGTINASLTNSGATIDPGDAVTPGTLTINGTFSQTSSGFLVSDLFANNSNDQLLVPGNTANVAGFVKLQLVSPYSPANGDTFTVINAGTLNDTSAKIYPAFGPNNTGFFTPITTATTLSFAATIPQADMSVAGTSAPASVVHNNTWSVTIPVLNNGPNGATGVTVTISPTNGTLSSVTSSQGSCLGNSCSVGSLSNGGSATITANITATTMSNVSATVTVAANESDPAAANNTATVSATVTPAADLALTIADAPDPVNAGGTVNYTATITNGGPDSSASVTTLTLSGGTFGTLPAGCGGSTPTITCTSGTIGNGGSANFVIPVTAPGAGPISLSGSVAASGATDGNSANNSASQSTAVTPQADLSITKTGPASVAAGSNITYTITVTNNGPSSALNVQVTDTTPAGLTFVSNTGACSTPFPCSLGTLASGATATITATYSTPSTSAPPSVTNIASVGSATTADPNGTNNSASASTSIAPSADVVVTAIAPSSAIPGSNFNVTVKIQNNGPSTATGISVSSTVPPAFAFVANGGACTTAYPCNIGTLNPGQFVQITSTYQAVSGGTSGTISYTASASTPDANTANNSASVTVTAGCPASAPTQLSPAAGSVAPAYGFLHWNNVGADEYNVYLGPAGSGCTQLFAKRSTHFGVNTDILYSLDPGTTYEWAVEAVTPGCPTLKSACVTFTTQSNCNAAAPQPVSPVGGIVPSPVTFTWTPSNGATLYTVKNAADDSVIGTSTTTSLPNIVVPDGPFTWYVVADVPSCGQLRSQNATFNGCSIPQAPVVGAVAEAATGQTYSVQWDRLGGAQSYELQEAGNEAFTGATTTVIGQPVTGNISVPFTKSTNSGALVFFYRARALSNCGQTFGPYSTPIRVVVLPPPPKTQKNPSVNVPVGSTQIVVQQVFVPGLNDGIVYTFTASVDQPWLTVDPSSGILPADGITLNVNANPANLPNGTITGTVIVTISSPSGKAGSNGATVVSTPVSVNLVTPIIPSTKDLPPDNTLIIPSVGHLDGVNSHWQSDIRLANTGVQKLQYALKFTPADPSTGGVKTTTITVDGGATTALDDIVRNWYGIGVLGESANGVLEVRPLTPSNKTGSDDLPSVNKVTVVSSRTYTTGDNGTLGQFIPAIPFTSFIGKAAQQAAASVLSLQQIAQSSQYRTNVGIVEGSGQPANVLVSIFDVNGKKLKDVPIALKGGEQAQFGSFLANVGIPSLNDGRIEVKVTSGDGRVTAYASVVDNQSTDPLLVTGVKLGAASADKYVLPGVANIDTGVANWRTDMRIFNGGTSAQNATLTFFRQGASPLTQSVVINAGEIRTLDDIVANLFGVSNSGGAVHVTTSGLSNLIVSGRTYNATANGTFGQFIPAVTTADSIASGDRPLQILQAEDSVRYRTNLGIAEVTGKPAGVDVSVVLPDSKVTPIVHIDLGANEFQQFDVFKSLGLENTYNARITVRVTGGDGRVTAYGSVVDMQTNDPTYVPALQ